MDRQELMPKRVHAGQYPTAPVSKATIPTTLNVAVPQVGKLRNEAATINSPATTNRMPFSVLPIFLTMLPSLFKDYVHTALIEQRKCQKSIQEYNCTFAFKNKVLRKEWREIRIRSGEIVKVEMLIVQLPLNNLVSGYTWIS